MSERKERTITIRLGMQIASIHQTKNDRRSCKD